MSCYIIEHVVRTLTCSTRFGLKYELKHEVGWVGYPQMLPPPKIWFSYVRVPFSNSSLLLCHTAQAGDEMKK